jgi:ADP-ribose pyrophosphatase YjhB (NUDIX family)
VVEHCRVPGPAGDVWQEQAKHCPLCSAELLEGDVGGRARRRCGSCGFVLYSNPASAAAGVVLNQRQEVLLVRRAIEPFRGFWALPAGYQEIDEQPADTVVREVREEAGIEVEVRGLLDLLFVPDDPRRPANVAVFLCRAVGGALHPGEEETEVRWFPLRALPERIGFDNYARILRRLLERDGYPESPWSLLREILERDHQGREDA